MLRFSVCEAETARRARATYLEFLTNGILGNGTFELIEESGQRVIHKFDNGTLFILSPHSWEVIMENGMMWVWHADGFPR